MIKLVQIMLIVDVILNVIMLSLVLAKMVPGFCVHIYVTNFMGCFWKMVVQLDKRDEKVEGKFMTL